eukprot:m.263200 g.263200  ORF g.263200 m.263200 type:complete len:842 (-) comp15600_c1_seq4:475-3000(-)
MARQVHSIAAYAGYDATGCLFDVDEAKQLTLQDTQHVVKPLPPTLTFQDIERCIRNKTGCGVKLTRQLSQGGFEVRLWGTPQQIKGAQALSTQHFIPKQHSSSPQNSLSRAASSSLSRASSSISRAASSCSSTHAMPLTSPMVVPSLVRHPQPFMPQPHSPMMSSAQPTYLQPYPLLLQSQPTYLHPQLQHHQQQQPQQPQLYTPPTGPALPSTVPMFNMPPLQHAHCRERMILTRQGVLVTVMLPSLAIERLVGGSGHGKRPNLLDKFKSTFHVDISVWQQKTRASFGTVTFVGAPSQVSVCLEEVGIMIGYSAELNIKRALGVPPSTPVLQADYTIEVPIPSAFASCVQGRFGTIMKRIQYHTQTIITRRHGTTGEVKERHRRATPGELTHPTSPTLRRLHLDLDHISERERLPADSEASTENLHSCTVSGDAQTVPVWVRDHHDDQTVLMQASEKVKDAHAWQMRLKSEARTAVDEARAQSFSSRSEGCEVEQGSKGEQAEDNAAAVCCDESATRRMGSSSEAAPGTLSSSVPSASAAGRAHEADRRTHKETREGESDGRTEQPYKVFQITGTRRGCEHAKLLLENICMVQHLKNVYEKPRKHPHRRYKHHHSSASCALPELVKLKCPSKSKTIAHPEHFYRVTFEISNNSSGILFGIEGSNIHYLQAEYASEISVSEGESTDTRVVMVSGFDSNRVQACYRYIMDLTSIPPSILPFAVRLDVPVDMQHTVPNVLQRNSTSIAYSWTSTNPHFLFLEGARRDVDSVVYQLLQFSLMHSAISHDTSISSPTTMHHQGITVNDWKALYRHVEMHGSPEQKAVFEAVAKAFQHIQPSSAYK